MEKILRKIALHICGFFYAAYLFIARLLRVAWFKITNRSEETRTLSAIKKANKLAKATGYRYYVLRTNGHIVIKPKRLLKNMIACKGKYFKQGTTIQDIEKTALYITH